MKSFDRRREERPPSHRPSTDAKRLRALWRISTATAGDTHEPLDAMLAEGAAAIRSGQPFVARLCRVDDAGALVVEAAAGAYFEPDAADLLAVGARIPLGETAHLDVVDAARTLSWNDLLADPAVAGRPAVRGAGWRALIATPFRVGPVQYLLSFLSPQPMARPFASDDEAYVEILSGYIERGLQQRWEAERLRFSMQHDPLTGLVNRAQFRALVRTTLDEAGGCGLAVVEVADFRNVNERLGHQTGDALLVEVGATLAQHNSDGEFTGRLYGGSFGICLPHTESRLTLVRRIADYAALFRTPFCTGDRHGANWVELAATFGTALAPDDATTADDLIEAADVAIAPFGRHATA